MKLSPNPDWSSPRRLALTALGVAAAAWVILTLQRGDITTRLGDTDDAMRLFLVRGLMHGQGWWDQLVTRLAPPHGVYMHWSRLLDGAIAGMAWLLGRMMPADAAEWATRYFWPRLWIPVAVGGALVIARTFGTRSAVFVAAPLMVSFLPLYRQFAPGRIDHHNIQITMAVLALAGAVSLPPLGGATRGARREGPPAPDSAPVAPYRPAQGAESLPPGGEGMRLGAPSLAGVAAGLGLAVGLEALAFQALAGMSFAARLMLDRRMARPVAAYGLALGASTLVFFGVQTPPWRWGLSFCDAIGLNLALALAVAGFGLAVVAGLAGRIGPRWRTGLLIAVGLASAAAYLVTDPACLHGPFAGLDPRVRPFWFDRIQEIQPLTAEFTGDLGPAAAASAMIVMGSAAAAYVAWRAWRPKAPDVRIDRVSALLLLAAMAGADVAGFKAWRMFDYVYWIGVAALAAGLSYLVRRVAKDRMVPTVALSIFLSPLFVGGAVGAIAEAASPNRAPDEGFPLCNAVAGFRPLAALPPGVVLSEIDLGPHLIANTPMTAVAAPYHRMAASILAAHDAFAAPPALAEARVRALGAAYVVDCRGSYMGVPAGSFGWRLRRGQIPPWLEPLSAPRTQLQVYRVRPAAPPAARAGVFQLALA